MSARQDDVVSRFKDAQQNPSEPAPVKLLEPSPFSSLPPTTREVQPTGRTVSPYDSPPVYTEKQQELLELRNQAMELEKERERLINEMKQKNFDSVETSGMSDLDDSELRHRGSQTQQIAVQTKAGDLAHRCLGNMGMMAKRLTLVNIR